MKKIILIIIVSLFSMNVFAETLACRIGTKHIVKAKTNEHGFAEITLNSEKIFLRPRHLVLSGKISINTIRNIPVIFQFNMV